MRKSTEAGNSMKQEPSCVRFNVHEKELKIQTKTLGAKAKIQSNYILMFKLAQKVIGFHMCVCAYFMWAHSPFMAWFPLWLSLCLLLATSTDYSLFLHLPESKFSYCAGAFFFKGLLKLFFLLALISSVFEMILL